MVLTSLVKRQLRVFAVLTVVVLGLGLVQYARVPAMAGIGVYDVQAQFKDASGLYPKAMVTYRGVKVGRVESLEVVDGKSEATLQIDDDRRIPADVIAEIHSTSAIGEQYVDLVADRGEGPYLEHGAVIPVDRTVAMPQISPVLESLNDLLDAIPTAATRRVLDEADKGLGGAGPDLASVVDSSSKLLDEAQLRIDATTSLIASLEPTLSTQRDLRDETLGYTSSLAEFASEVAARDDDLRDLLADGPDGLSAARDLVEDLQPTLPLLLENLTTNGQVLHTYLPELKQVLVMYPVTVARLQSTINPRAGKGDVFLNLRTNVNDPPACSQGYLPPSKRRSPSAAKTRSVDLLAHCTVPDPDPRSVRGARLLPCPSGSGRGPTPASCGLTFRSGVWPASTRPTAYDLALGQGPEEAANGASSDAVDEVDSQDSWMALVLAPLELQ